MDSSHPLEVKNFTSAFILLGVGMVGRGRGSMDFTNDILTICMPPAFLRLRTPVNCVLDAKWPLISSYSLVTLSNSFRLAGYRNCVALHGALFLPLFTTSVAALGSNGTLWFNFNEYGTFTKLSQVRLRSLWTSVY